MKTQWIPLITLIVFALKAPADIRKNGDKVQYAIPAVALTSTLVLSDYEGTKQLVKSFTASQLTTEALKHITRRERPDGSNRLSFPSGHASASFQSAAFIHFRYGVGYAVPAYAAATFVAYSRVHSKRHHITDVIAGAALGIAASWYFTSRKGLRTVQAMPLKDGLAIQYKASW